MNKAVLFGAGADIDAAPDYALRGDHLLLKTFRHLDKAKEDAGYLDAFSNLFGSVSKLSYSWKRTVREMIQRALRNNSTELLGGSETEQTLSIGTTKIRIAQRFMDLLKNGDKENTQASKLIFHIIFAMYGAGAACDIVNTAADNIQTELKNVGVDLPQELYDKIDIKIHHDPEQDLIDATTKAVQESMASDGQDSVLDNILVRLLDYTIVFDQVFSDLTTDKYQIISQNGQTSALRRAVHFLFALKSAAQEMDGEPGPDSYYHRIPEGTEVFTMNYTSILDRVLQQRGLPTKAVYLHGKHSESFDLLSGQLSPSWGGIPFIMPQTSSKPIASVETIRRFAKFLDALDQSRELLSVGYGFNRDDDHVTNMIHDAMRKNSMLVLKILSLEGIDRSTGVKRLKNEFGDRIVTFRVSQYPDQSREKFNRMLK